MTDEFLQYIRQKGPDWDLEETSHFLVVAATLLDLKVVKLLPGAELEDTEDLALLEARDLLFARLMQYRAYKDVSATFSQMMNDAPLMVPRTVGVDPDLQGCFPTSCWAWAPMPSRRWPHWPSPRNPRRRWTPTTFTPAGQRRRAEGDPRGLVAGTGHATFRDLIEDADSRMVVVGRFLALLELYRDGTVRFEQEKALAQLTIVWEDSSDRSGD